MAALVTGTAAYALIQFQLIGVPLSPILAALPASALAMWLGGRFGKPENPEMMQHVGRLHEVG
jgi:hypothetical protein